MPPRVQSQRWPSDRAILFVHGIGNANVGDYNALVAQIEQILGADATRFAVYFLYYDEINDWFAAKTSAGVGIQQLIGAIRSKSASATTPELGNAIAEFAGDVLWPILAADARTAIRDTYLNQLRQIVRDGEDSAVAPRNQRVSIIAHSLGCFHTYEALWEAATDAGQGLSPARWGVQLENVIYMASPVQLISTVAKGIDVAIPNRDRLHSVSAPTLESPFETNVAGKAIPSARRTVSITGSLDPVGGHFFGARAAWAYMNLPAQESYVDEQKLLGDQPQEALLSAVLHAALRDDGPPAITPANPHDWSAYVRRHGEQIRGWLLS